MTNVLRPELAVTLICAAALVACGPAEPAPGEPAATPVADAPAATAAETRAEGPVVVFLGDSLTAGYGLAASEALPARVEAELKARGVEVQAVNAGVSGDTTQGALDRYDWSVASAKPNLLIIALGANDYLNGLPAETPRTNLGRIIERAKADGVQVALLGVRTPNMSGADARDQAYAAIYPGLAKQYDVPLYASMLDGVMGEPDLVQGDGLHPTAQGVEIMAKQIADFLEPPVRAMETVGGP